MAITQNVIAKQMVEQLRILDPSASAEVGTPERKIIDTVAQALADAQVDLNLLSEAFDIDSKFGQDLDRFLAIFGFARQKGSAASGVIEFSRESESSFDIRIPAFTQLTANVGTLASDGFSFNQAFFETTSDIFLPAGDLVVTGPIRSTSVGQFNNVAAEAINTFVGTPVLGITGVTNPVATTGGQDAESDNELKVRFRNTVFRNLAGTSDQFLALAVTGAFTNKANVIGPISRYREFIQIPELDDASAYDVDDDGDEESGNGSVGEYSTAVSTIPYSEYTYKNNPVFISNGQTGPNVLYYMQDVDFELNTTAEGINRGDAYRLDQADPPDLTKPSVTFLNVFTGDEDVDAVVPEDILVFEHSYISSASRNDWERNITNCIDIYINGENSTLASTVMPIPRLSVNPFVDNAANRFHFDNYRRLGEPDHRPVIGNVFTPLYWSPILAVPESISIGEITYRRGVHYWPIIDVSEIRGTVRARTGVEWSSIENGQDEGDDSEGPYTGAIIVNHGDDTVEIDDYSFDKNIIDLQTAFEGAKQVTTDVLVHQAVERFFRFDITIMYSSAFNDADVNQAIQDTLAAWFSGMTFGTIIQLSDVLQQIHNTPGVDNVRWSRDLDSNLNCITETNVDGVPRLGVVIDRVVKGTDVVEEIQQMYFTGAENLDQQGTYTLTGDSLETDDISPYAGPDGVEEALVNAGVAVTVPSGIGTPDQPYRIEWDDIGVRDLITADVSDLAGGNAVFNDDFFLRDNELPALPDGDFDADLAGLIIRPRTQNTWLRG